MCYMVLGRGCKASSSIGLNRYNTNEYFQCSAAMDIYIYVYSVYICIYIHIICVYTHIYTHTYLCMFSGYLPNKCICIYIYIR